MKRKLTQTFKFLFFISLGIFLFWKVYKDQPVEELIDAATKINYLWIFFAVIIGLLSHVIRAIRWAYIFESMEKPQKPSLLYHSVMIGYLANFAFPRMGELTRAAVVKKYGNVPFSTAFGTIITERIVDMVVLGALTVVGFLFQPQFFKTFISNNPGVSEKVAAIFTWQTLVIAVFLILSAGIILGIVVKKIGVYKGLMGKFFEKLKTLRDGLFSIMTLKRPTQYIILSLLIWGLYFLGMLIVKPAFASLGMNVLTTTQILAVFLMGSYAMLAPVQGGIGAYHFMVIVSLVIFGIDDATARLFALVVHGVNVVVIVLGGLISLIVLNYSETGFYQISTQSKIEHKQVEL
ncbi:MAG TPA: lysylphosphatidylglycerol synthase transmembrane domain-containing protein [Salinivirgaceae bacterium]|nr:lysylphosphatidylglycerol synthase transmembrane domain-containing protein [Salinivirgaceae bacterium]